jgi:site-specific DNA recombinase
MENKQTNPTERFMEEMFRIMGEYHQSQLSEQVAMSMQRKAEAGYWLHKPLLGYSPSDEKGVYIVNSQGRALQDLMKRLAQGDISKEYFHYALSNVLPLSPKLVASIARIKILVANPFYTGKVAFKGKLYNGLHEPLISPEEQEQIIENLSK